MELPVKTEEVKAPEKVAPPAANNEPPKKSLEDKLRDLELENAELRGKASVLEKPKEEVRTPVPEVRSQREVQWEQTKATVSTHLNSMDDDAFEEQYKMTKDAARAQLVQGDQQLYTEKMNERTARMEAENRLFRRFSDYSEYESEIREAISDAAPEIRQDPDRLTRYLERHYKAAKANKPAPVKKEDPMNRRVVHDFEPPNPAPDLNKAPAPAPDEIKDDNKQLCKAFGIESEEERKQFMKTNEIPMNMGGGIVFRDSKKGIEKIKP